MSRCRPATVLPFARITPADGIVIVPSTETAWGGTVMKLPGRTYPVSFGTNRPGQVSKIVTPTVSPTPRTKVCGPSRSPNNTAILVAFTAQLLILSDIRYTCDMD